MEIEVAIDAHAIIGESPTWSVPERALYWIDIKEPALHRFDPHSGASRSWRVGSDIGAFAFTRDGRALLALRQGIQRLNLATGAIERLAPPPFDAKLFRFNEGMCDSGGRFWVGVMFDPVEGPQAPEAGFLHSFTLRDGLRQENDKAELHNGMALSGDGRRFFVSHSNAGAIYTFDFDPQAGLLGAAELFAQVPPALGLPDGAAIDVEGGYWCAVHGGGRLHRYTPDGRLDREILLPIRKPTMCAFGGDDLDTLYVTSASDGLDADQLRAEPLAGAVLRLRPGVAGIARPCTVC